MGTVRKTITLTQKQGDGWIKAQIARGDFTKRVAQALIVEFRYPQQ